MIVTAKQISKIYGQNTALNSVDIHIESGEILALLGENGAGKTTTISILLGFIKADSGIVKVLDENPVKLSVAARSRIGFVLQDEERSLHPLLTAREHLQQVCGYYRHHEDLNYCAEVTGISAVLTKKYQDLSGGQKRSLQYSMAICGNPKLLFLDEPTVGMDVRTRHRVWEHLREMKKRGTSVLLTTHYLEEAEMLADRVVVLERGKNIYSGEIASITGVGSTTIITCKTALPEQIIKSHPTVLYMHIQEEFVSITTSDSDAFLHWLLPQDPSLCGISMRKGGLTDLFLQLTQKTYEQNI